MLLIFPAIAVLFSTVFGGTKHCDRRSLRKERKSQKSSLISKEKVNKGCRSVEGHNTWGAKKNTNNKTHTQHFSAKASLGYERVRPVHRSKSPKLVKEGFRVKTPISHHPRQRHFESKNPHVEPCREMGILDSKRPCLGHWKMGVFLTLNPSFTDFFGVF